MNCMTANESSASATAGQIFAIREFNRFYTAKLGLLRKRHLDGEFSLTEARILYEISANPSMTASVLRRTLQLDAGYISRLLSSLTRRRLVRQVFSKADGREKQLTLTASGSKAVARLNEQSTLQLQEMLANITAADREALVASLEKTKLILSAGQRQRVRVERVTTVTEEVTAILQEYYEAVQVVQRDKPGSVERLMKEAGSGVWLAYLEDEVVGCVVLRRLAAMPRASECKRLYVKPASRGMRIADRLLDAQEEYARGEGIEWIYLDSHDGLKAAIALYERRGYQRCERYNDNPQATVFMRKRIVSSPQ